MIEWTQQERQFAKDNGDEDITEVIDGFNSCSNAEQMLRYLLEMSHGWACERWCSIPIGKFGDVLRAILSAKNKEVTKMSETIADIVREIGELKGERKGILKANAAFAADNTRLRGELAAKDAEIVELRGAFKKAYATLYSISCARYGKGLTCTDSIHDLVTMARECADELYADENLRNALEGGNNAANA